MSDFLSRLRSLDAAASRPPWSETSGRVYDADGYWMALTYDAETTRLLLALRNRAARIAALVEAAADVVLPERCGLGDVTEGAVLTDVEAAHLRRLAAELAALDKEGAS